MCERVREFKKRREMRYYMKSLLVLVISITLLLNACVLLYVSSTSQHYSQPVEVPLKIWSPKTPNNIIRHNHSRNTFKFNPRRFSSNGSEIQRHEESSEEQKRITPFGANPLHNRWEIKRPQHSLVLSLSLLYMHE